MISDYEQMVIDWMSNKGAPEWHGVARGWNWDNDLAPLFWIVDQEDCDKATALSVFWLSDPHYYIDKDHHAYIPRGEVHELVHKILGNWNRYKTARFHFGLPSYVEHLNSEKWGLSKECLQVLQPMLIEIDGQERYPMYGPDGPEECRVAYKELSGKPISEIDRELLAHERASKNLSPTREEVAVQYKRETEKWLSDLEDLVSIEDPIAQVHALVENGTLTHDQGDGLIKKLAQVLLAKLDADQTGAACNQLDAFISQVNGFINSGALAPGQGQALIDAVNALKTNLGCQ